MDTYGESLFPPIKVAQRSLVVGEGADPGPQISEEREVTLGLDEVRYYTDLCFGASFGCDQRGCVPLREVVIERGPLANVHKLSVYNFG